MSLAMDHALFLLLVAVGLSQGQALEAGPQACCSGNISGVVYGPSPKQIKPFIIFENVVAYTYTSGLQSSVLGNASTGPVGYMFVPELAHDFFWASETCVKIPDAQTTLPYCTGPGNYWDDYRGVSTFPNGNANWWSASSEKDVFNMWYDVATCFPTIQIGGFDKQSSWAYFNMTNSDTPPPGAFVLPEYCKKAEEASPELARQLVRGTPMALMRRGGRML